MEDLVQELKVDPWNGTWDALAIATVGVSQDPVWDIRERMDDLMRGIWRGILLQLKLEATEMVKTDPGALVRVARHLYQNEGSIEIDDNAKISRADGPTDGTYVQAWVWVPDEELLE